MPHKPIIFWHHRPSSSWSQEQPLNTLRVFSKISLENQCKEIVLQKTVLALPFYYAEMRQKKLTRVTGSFFIKPVLFSDCSCSTKKKKKRKGKRSYQTRMHVQSPVFQRTQDVTLHSLKIQFSKSQDCSFGRRKQPAMIPFKDFAMLSLEHGHSAAQRTPGIFVTRCQ